jgi:hypothetical protein
VVSTPIVKLLASTTVIENRRPFSCVMPATPEMKTWSPLLYPCAVTVTLPGLALVIAVMAFAAANCVTSFQVVFASR